MRNPGRRGDVRNVTLTKGEGAHEFHRWVAIVPHDVALEVDVDLLSKESFL